MAEKPMAAVNIAVDVRLHKATYYVQRSGIPVGFVEAWWRQKAQSANPEMVYRGHRHSDGYAVTEVHTSLEGAVTDLTRGMLVDVDVNLETVVVNNPQITEDRSEKPKVDLIRADGICPGDWIARVQAGPYEKVVSVVGGGGKLFSVVVEGRSEPYSISSTAWWWRRTDK